MHKSQREIDRKTSSYRIAGAHTADLLRTKINFSYGKMHATAARGLTRDATFVWCLISRERLRIFA